MVPREATALMAARTDHPVPAAESHALAADLLVPTVSSSSSDLVRVIYQVRSGDTLASIARVFRTTVAAIKTWNRLPDTRIRTGERLTIYTARAN